MPHTRPQPSLDLAVIGGGAAGFFAAISAAESADKVLTIRIFESEKACLRKVKVAGGGRCNLTHACPSINDFCRNYPRGTRELLGPMHAFGPAETMAWFTRQGITLKTEPDGRVFPVSDKAADVVNCLLARAEQLDVQIETATRVTEIKPLPTGRFELQTGSARKQICERVLLAMGGGSSEAYGLVQRLDHTVNCAVPALFGLKTGDNTFKHLAGLSVRDCTLTLPDLRLSSRGPLLFTQWGITGPAALKLSSLAAKQLHERHYKAPMHIAFCPSLGKSDIDRILLRRFRLEGLYAYIRVLLSNYPPDCGKRLRRKRALLPTRRGPACPSTSAGC